MSVRPNPLLGLPFEPAIEGLGTEYWDVVEAATFPQTHLRFHNDPLLHQLGLDAAAIRDADLEAAYGSFEGRTPLLALRYHGYQFGSYNPQLGDGRGFLHGQLRDRHGQLQDLGTKGSGTTPWSRGGEGRLTLKGGVREVIASEALQRLGVTTSRTLSLIETGEGLWRGDEPSPTRSSVMVRMARTHLRFGTCERLLHLRQPAQLERLLRHVVAVHYPHLQAIHSDTEQLLVAFYGELVERVARLAAEWMAAGFTHGVLNTDNMSLAGESFDYGPFAFLETWDPGFTAAYFDHSGLYAYGRQPLICQHNLRLLQEPLAMLLSRPPLEAALEGCAAAWASRPPRCPRARWRISPIRRRPPCSCWPAGLWPTAVSSLPWPNASGWVGCRPQRRSWSPSWRRNRRLRGPNGWPGARPGGPGATPLPPVGPGRRTPSPPASAAGTCRKRRSGRWSSGSGPPSTNGTTGRRCSSGWRARWPRRPPKGADPVRVRRPERRPVSGATALPGDVFYNTTKLRLSSHRSDAMTSEQAAQLIDNTLDLVHQRLQDLESQSLDHEHRALAAEFREWRQPAGGHIDLMVFPGLAES